MKNYSLCAFDSPTYIYIYNNDTTQLFLLPFCSMNIHDLVVLGTHVDSLIVTRNCACLLELNMVIKVKPYHELMFTLHCAK